MAELVPALVAWNREHLGRMAGQPFENARSRVPVADVRLVLKLERTGFGASLLDLDNGVKGPIRRENDRCYSFLGLNAVFDPLRPRGVLAVCSAWPNGGCADRLLQVGFDVDETEAQAKVRTKAPSHHLAGHKPRMQCS